jgi:Protein of unknown function (DUF2029).
MEAFDRLRTYRLSPWERTWLGRGIAVTGFLVLARVLLVQGIVGDGGGGGIDAIAYWTASKAAATGATLYGTAEGVFGAYAYPPPLAQLLVPFSGLPVAVFVWGWRFVEIACLRMAVGSWTRAGWALLFPPVLAELDAGNVHLIMAAVCAFAMRSAAAPIGPSALFKFASLPLAPIGWVRDRRGLIGGIAVAAAVCAVSIAIDRQGWTDWLGFLSKSTIPSGLHNVAEALPLPLRLVAAGALGIAAIRWVRGAPIAVVLTYPVVWIDALSTLVAVFAPVPAGQVAKVADDRLTDQAAAVSATVSS